MGIKCTLTETPVIVISSIIDQNWDLKGFKAVFIKILETLKIHGKPAAVKLEKYIEKLLNS